MSRIQYLLLDFLKKKLKLIKSQGLNEQSFRMNIDLDVQEDENAVTFQSFC